MTISSTVNKVQYAGNAVTTAFAFSPVFFAASDLSVKLTLAATNAAVSPDPVLNGAATYDYTVTGTLDSTTGEYLSGGTVTFNNAPLSTHTITIQRIVPATQSLATVDNSKFPAAPVNTEFDRLTLISQYVLDAIGSAIRGPATDPSTVSLSLVGALQRANTLLGFDSAGNAISTSAGISIGLVTPYMQTVLAAATSLAARSLLVTGGLTDNNNWTGANLFVTPSADNTSSNLNATVFYADRAIRALNIRYQSFLATGTYIPNSQLIFAELEAWGGGGGGGGTANTGAGVVAGGAGGGAGGYAWKVANAALIGASLAVTIGVAGGGGNAGNNAGFQGSATIVGSLLTAGPGLGGAGNSGAALVAGGAGGVGTVGDMLGQGQYGTNGQTFLSAASGAGNGGSSFWGIGGIGPVAQGNGNAGIGRSAGGSGGLSSNAGGQATGGAGVAGIVRIKEFCKT